MKTEQIPNSEIITKVPGSSPGDAESADAQPNDQPEIRAGGNVVMSGFKGDPSRVAGHPSNPWTGPVQAYKESMARRREDQVAAEQSRAGTAVEGLITGLPEFPQPRVPVAVEGLITGVPESLGPVVLSSQVEGFVPGENPPVDEVKGDQQDAVTPGSLRGKA